MEEANSVLEMIMTAWEQMSWVEVWAVIAGVIYVILAARENIWCWSFGIINAVLSIYLFYTGKLYAESILYIYYVLAGFYGWWSWQKRASDSRSSVLDQEETHIKGELKIQIWTWQRHGLIVFIGVVLSGVLAFLLRQYTDAQIPIIDAFTTVFSFIATYMVTQKVLENWLYWIVIDLITIGMYWHRAYYLYALLMIVYTFIAIIGFINWYKKIKKRP